MLCSPPSGELTHQSDLPSVCVAIVTQMLHQGHGAGAVSDAHRERRRRSEEDGGRDSGTDRARARRRDGGQESAAELTEHAL